MKHIVYLMCGPSGCGKTTMAFSIAADVIKGRTKVISSDIIRDNLLGAINNPAHDKRMSYVSEKAFSILYNELHNFMRWPVNVDNVIVDTTSLNAEHREKILKIAKDNNYGVVLILFNYKTREEYLQGNEDKRNNSVILRHVDRLRKDVLPCIEKTYLSVIKIKNKGDYTPFTNWYKSEKTINNFISRDCFAIGDVHGCCDELKQLLKANNLLTEKGEVNDSETDVILCGDYVDKGTKVKEVVEFLYENKSRVRLVKGNHENFVYKWLKGEINRRGMTPEVLANFDSIQLFEKNEELRNKFFVLVEMSYPFVYNDHMFVTHAPCENKYLGKLDDASVKKQRNFIYPKETDKIRESLDFVYKEATNNQPLHLFGHIASRGNIKVKNKLFIDGGCVYGGSLVGVHVNMKGEHTIKRVKSHQEYIKGELYAVNDSSQVTINTGAFNFLDYREQKRVIYAAKNKVNFISGTMSPPESDGVELESIKQALAYYKSKGVSDVCAQPKYMGSRANVYLFKNIEECYTTTRNGFIIKKDKLDLTNIYKRLQEKIKIVDSDAKLHIIDGELLPWRALGEGLIDRSFAPILKYVGQEIAELRQMGFEPNLEAARGLTDKSGWHKDKDADKKQLIEKYGHHRYSSNKALDEYKHINLVDQFTCIADYANQLDYYGQTSELEFKPFALLKTIYKDNREEVYDNELNHTMFNTLNNDSCYRLDVNDLNAAEKYFNHLVNQNQSRPLEGVVIKPATSYVKGVAPFIKVRNKNYLRLVYGYDYDTPNRYARLLKKKNVRKKIELSIREYELGRRMLSIPYNDIKEDNDVYKNLVAMFITEERNEKGLDPRL